jgi:NADPH:quinone reductase-like Zn-dependent oxidoreductase
MHRAPSFATLDAWRSCLCMNRMDVARIFDSASETRGVQREFMKQGTDLRKKRVVILGGSSGIGFAVAEQASTQGAEIVIASSNPERVQRAVEKLEGNAQGHALDLSDESAVENFFANLSQKICRGLFHAASC